MLILTVRSGKKIFIGKDISCTFLAKKGNSIKLGIEAPSEILIRREEIIGKPKQKKNKKNLLEI